MRRGLRRLRGRRGRVNLRVRVGEERVVVMEFGYRFIRGKETPLAL